MVFNFLKISSFVLLQRNIIELCILTLYSGTLVNSLISSSSFIFKDSFGFCVYTIMSPENKDSHFFLLFMPFIYFSCLISLARSSSTVQNRSCKSLPCSQSQGKAFSLSLLDIMLAKNFSWRPFIRLRKFLSLMGVKPSSFFKGMASGARLPLLTCFVTKGRSFNLPLLPCKMWIMMMFS